MFSLVDNLSGCSRRDFLQIGALGLGGLTLPGLLAAEAAAAKTGSLAKGKSVIFLFMHGGPSQFETFDPKMTASERIRSATGETKTSVPSTCGWRSSAISTRRAGSGCWNAAGLNWWRAWPGLTRG